MPKPMPMKSADAPESAETPQAPAAKAVPVTAPKKSKPRYVRIENKLRQSLSLSIVNDDGQAAELKLGPLATSAPLREDRLTDQVRRFAAAGKVRIR